MGNETIVRTTIRLPQPLLERAKIRAIKDGTSFQNLVIEALKSYLKGERQ
jgi:predicted DNA binding CopG/RHH family protein